MQRSPSKSRVKIERPASRPRQTLGELKELQRLAFSAIRRPLTASNAMQRTWVDGRPTAKVVADFIKPNDRLSSLERIELYNKQYWFRLLDCLYDDYPGLRAILGEIKFRKLRIAYLSEYPSMSFTMRNLGSHLVEFLEGHLQYISPHTDMCMDMARFEWAQVVAFDGVQLPPLVPDDLLGRDPQKLTLGLQPYVTLLRMAYPLDEFVLAIKKKSLRAEASNAMEMEEQSSSRKRTVRLPRRERIFIGMHRWQNSLYYKRLEPAQYRLLSELRDGRSVADACERAIESEPGGDTDWAERIRNWFQVFTELGWLCARSRV
jgi:putative DNA-binding protein